MLLGLLEYGVNLHSELLSGHFRLYISHLVAQVTKVSVVLLKVGRYFGGNLCNKKRVLNLSIKEALLAAETLCPLIKGNKRYPRVLLTINLVSDDR